jgi:hypothetical protein
MYYLLRYGAVYPGFEGISSLNLMTEDTLKE